MRRTGKKPPPKRLTQEERDEQYHKNSAAIRNASLGPTPGSKIWMEEAGGVTEDQWQNINSILLNNAAAIVEQSVTWNDDGSCTVVTTHTPVDWEAFQQSKIQKEK